MRVLTSRAELRAALGESHPGLVPTMGALHEGHLALIRHAVSEQPVTIVSIFVNPAQFNDPADLAKYPRDLDRDLAMVDAAGVDYVFAPPVAEIYPPGFATSVDVGGLSDRWEGAARPGHFRGVATVVTILLNLVRPARAYFGEKDYQQLLVIRRLHADLALPGEIIGYPTVRDSDGLALSSRNVRLAPELRQQARLIPQALTEISLRTTAGETDCARLLAAGRDILATGPDLRLDYLAIVDPADLTPLTTLTGPARIIAAVYAGPIRLIDNLALSSPRGDRAPGRHSEPS